jgi:hypothetical protein
VAQRVGMDVADSRGGGDVVEDPGDGVPVQGGAVLARQQQRMPGRDVRGPVLGDQRHQVWMQGKVAVLAELADRDVQTGRGADLVDRVGGQGGELPDP